MSVNKAILLGNVGKDPDVRYPQQGQIIVTFALATTEHAYKTAEGARKTLGRRLFGVANGFCRLYLTVLRGTPVVVQLMIIYFVIFAWSDNGTMVAALKTDRIATAQVVLRPTRSLISRGSTTP